MASTNTAAAVTAEELTAKDVQKRYEGLVMVRNKAVKGKGAWYWAHLEPVLVHNHDSGLPKAVKLRCSLCDAQFSASNPSRTASEHLKRGTCPNFTSSVPRPISSISPPPQPHHNHRKRSISAAAASSSYQAVPHLAMVEASRFSGADLGYPPEVSSSPPPPPPPQRHLMLSGGKEDLGALAMLEDCVKKLKSPKASPGPTLTKARVDSALDSLADWLYESCGSVSFSSLDHPKFGAFLHQVGLPPISWRDLLGARLDSKFEETKSESEAKIRDAMFFQIAADGFRIAASSAGDASASLVNLTVNLPNGTSVFRRAVFTGGGLRSEQAEQVLWETVTDICGGSVQQCVGIVADRFKTKALKNLERQHQWMVNLSCQFQGLNTLVEDFAKHLPLFKTVGDNCFKVASFVNDRSQVRASFHRYQLQECGYAVPLRLSPLFAMAEDVLSSARALELVLLDESFKIASMEDPVARQVSDMIRDVGFWNEVEAVHSLVKLVKEMAHKIEADRPLIGECLPIWVDLRTKVKDWCSKFQIEELSVEKAIDRRFQKNYHPAWAAAFILDPLYLIRDASGKYLPPFKYLTIEQEKDVDRLITRLVSREEAHVALMELMKWRTEGLDPVYARAVQMKERDPITGKMRLVNPQSSRLVWETYLTEFKSLRKVVVRLIFLHATSCGFKCNGSLLRWVGGAQGKPSRIGMERAQKMVFIAAHSKLERREFSTEEEKDAELFASVNGEDDVLNEVFVDTS